MKQQAAACQKHMTKLEIVRFYEGELAFSDYLSFVKRDSLLFSSLDSTPFSLPVK